MKAKKCTSEVEYQFYSDLNVEIRVTQSGKKEDTITNEVKRLGWIREMRIINIIQLSYSHEEIY